VLLDGSPAVQGGPVYGTISDALVHRAPTIIALPVTGVRVDTLKECGGARMGIPAARSEHQPPPGLRLISMQRLWSMQNVE
jgi:hypothetical protein